MSLPGFRSMLRAYPSIAVPLSLVYQDGSVMTVLSPPGFNANFLYSVGSDVEEALANLDQLLQGMFTKEEPSP